MTSPSRDVIVDLIENHGWTRTAVAEAYGVTPQAIHKRLNPPGSAKYLDPIQRAMQHIPWDVASEHKDSRPWRMLQNHLKFVVLQGRGLSDDELERLHSWYAELRRVNVVLEYDPDEPPTYGLASGGWRYPQRQASDNDLVIRVNALARMTDEAYEYWRFPEGA